MNPTEIPYNIDAEVAIVHGVLGTPAAFEDYSDLEPHMFYLAKHAQIWRAIARTAMKGQPPNAINVAQTLTESGDLERIGGTLALVPDTWIASWEIAGAADIVRKLATRRALIQAANTIARLGYNQRGDLDTQIADAHQALAAATTNTAKDNGKPIADILDHWYDMQIAEDDDRADLIPTGFRDFDELGGGFRRGDLVILAARPGVGKTGCALSIALNIAARGGMVDFYSLEMDENQLADRIVAMNTTIDSTTIRKRNLDGEAIRQIAGMMGEVRRQRLIIDDTTDRTVQAIRSIATQHQHRYGTPDLIIIDYLGLIDPGDRYAGNRVNEVAEISRALKRMARQMDVPILALHQLSRDVEKRNVKKPQLSDLRDSGAVEQDADIVIFIYRADMYEDDSDAIGTAELIIAKYRNGPPGTIPMRFDRTTTRFSDLSYRTPEGY